ncbi:hypothetical protein GM3709_765 [Geminocystis sp. NIES-3709]|nr:hypothetical protein GM3709_765 [Geminocystis sp. NIES-3709]
MSTFLSRTEIKLIRFINDHIFNDVEVVLNKIKEFTIQYQLILKQQEQTPPVLGDLTVLEH